MISFALLLPRTAYLLNVSDITFSLGCFHAGAQRLGYFSELFMVSEREFKLAITLGHSGFKPESFSAEGPDFKEIAI
jgi:hypothetical protein